MYFHSNICGFPGPLHDDDEYDDYDEFKKSRQETRSKWTNEDYKIDYSEDGTAHCQTCKKEFATPISAKKHYRNMHGPEPSRLIKCSICFKCFKLRDYFRDHLRTTHHISGIRNIIEAYGIYVDKANV